MEQDVPAMKVSPPQCLLEGRQALAGVPAELDFEQIGGLLRYSEEQRDVKSDCETPVAAKGGLRNDGRCNITAVMK